MIQASEYNFDGLVGPTHNYAGLSVGNVASLKNAMGAANPKEAALQGLAKMKALQDLGLPQAVLAPMERPDISTLRRLGFAGNDAKVLSDAAKKAPELLLALQRRACGQLMLALFRQVLTPTINDCTLQLQI